MYLLIIIAYATALCFENTMLPQFLVLVLGFSLKLFSAFTLNSSMQRFQFRFTFLTFVILTPLIL
jgi:hypothetical protein